jgi:hypothetical protein
MEKIIKVMREKGFDRHIAPACLIALRELEVIKIASSY